MSADGIRIKGMFRVQLTEEGKVVGDSGWRENQITNDGFNDFLCKSLGAMTNGSKQITHMGLGTGGAPAASDTSLSGEVQKRASVTAASSSTSKTVRFVGTFSSSNSFVTTSYNISNIGLFNASSAGTLFAGNTFASSSIGTNQNVNATYDIIFN